MNEDRIPLYCVTCHKLLGKIKKGGYCKGLILFCRSCKCEREITNIKIKENDKN